MEIPITLWLAEDEHAAIAAQATTYGRTPEGHVRIWIADPLAQALRAQQADQWDRRRKVIETDADVAAVVDAKVRTR